MTSLRSDGWAVRRAGLREPAGLRITDSRLVWGQDGECQQQGFLRLLYGCVPFVPRMQMEAYLWFCCSLGLSGGPSAQLLLPACSGQQLLHSHLRRAWSTINSRKRGSNENSTIC